MKLNKPFGALNGGGLPCPPGALGMPFLPPVSLPNSMGIHPTPLSALTAAARNPTLPMLQPPMSNIGGPIRRRLAEKTHIPMPSGE